MQRIIRIIKILKDQYFLELYPFRKDPCKTCIVKAKCKYYDCREGYDYHIRYQPFENKIGLTLFRCLVHVFLIANILILLKI